MQQCTRMIMMLIVHHTTIVVRAALQSDVGGSGRKRECDRRGHSGLHEYPHILLGKLGKRRVGHQYARGQRHSAPLRDKVLTYQLQEIVPHLGLLILKLPEDDVRKQRVQFKELLGSRVERDFQSTSRDERRRLGRSRCGGCGRRRYPRLLMLLLFCGTYLGQRSSVGVDHHCRRRGRRSRTVEFLLRPRTRRR